MKPFIFKILLVFTVLGMVSCDNEGEDLIKYYKSQNHSEELKGWWKKINYIENEENPNKIFFDDYKVQFYSFNIHNGQYGNIEEYWYNDDEKIYLLMPGDFKVKSDEDSYHYQLNATNDTLKIYMENPPYIYVKDTGL